MGDLHHPALVRLHLTCTASVHMPEFTLVKPPSNAFLDQEELDFMTYNEDCHLPHTICDLICDIAEPPYHASWTRRSCTL